MDSVLKFAESDSSFCIVVIVFIAPVPISLDEGEGLCEVILTTEGRRYERVEDCSAEDSTRMSFVCFGSSMKLSEFGCKLGGGESAMVAGDDVVDIDAIVFVKAVLSGELVLLVGMVTVVVITVDGEVINGVIVEPLCKGDIGPGDDVKNSLRDTC